jgi:SOS response regulatory protein OraA/RecX
VCIKQALHNLDTDETQARLAKLAAKKYALLKGERPKTRKQKTITYLLGRGFSFDEIEQALIAILKE